MRQARSTATCVALAVVAALGIAGGPAAPAAAQQADAATATSATTGSGDAWTTLGFGARGERVLLIQRVLLRRGYPLRGGADGFFGVRTVEAVRTFQRVTSLFVTGTVDAPTAISLGVASPAAPASPASPEPSTSSTQSADATGVPDPPTPAGSLAAGLAGSPELDRRTTKACPAEGHGAVVDRARQRAWLCDDGVPLDEFTITSARDQPDPGSYRVFSKSLHSSSFATGEYTTMTYFTAFARGEVEGARVGFHSVPVDRTGSFIQPLSSVGSLAVFGRTAGCVRTLPHQAAKIYQWLKVGDEVVVVS